MKKVEEDIINPALMLAVSRMREHDTPENRNRMLMEAMNARYLVPFSVALKQGTEQEEKRTAENTRMSFPMVKTKDGTAFFVAFSDAGEMAKGKEDSKPSAMVMSFDDLAGMVERAGTQADGFVLNPSTTNLVFRKKMIQDLISLRDQAIAEGKMVKVTPEEKKDAMEDTIRQQNQKSEA